MEDKQAITIEEIKARHSLSITDILLILVAVIWGLNYVIAKISLKEMDPLLFNSLRFVIGAMTCWLLVFVREKDISINRTQFWKLILFGIFIHGMNQITFIYGVSKTTAAATSIILASTPVWVALMASLLKLEKNNLSTWIGIIISFIGVTVVVISSGLGHNSSGASVYGNILVVIATFFWSLYTITIRMWFKDLSPIKVTAYSLSFAALFFVTISFNQIIQAEWEQFSLNAWGGVLFSGVFVFGISYMLWNSGIKKVGPTRTSIYANLPPFVSAVAGWLLLNERITAVQILGGVMIIIGLRCAAKAKESPAVKVGCQQRINGR